MGESGKFWEALETATRHAGEGSTDSAQRALDQAVNYAREFDDALSHRRVQLIERLAMIYRLNLEPEAFAAKGDVRPAGVSLVTSCRNRNENLIKALPSWLANPDVSEVIIVDWTSETAVASDLAVNGIEDARIRVIRVENEPRWILAYPFNLGFQSARFDKILKVDADIVIQPDFFRRNPLKRRQFIAGNWRTAAEGQAFVNGFFYVLHRDLIDLAGFNEYITTYGWDDEELYARLVELGIERHDVASDCIFHLPHDDAARTEKKRPSGKVVASDTLPTETTFLIRRNRQIANLMPAWNSSRPVAHYRTLENRGVETVLQRVEESGATASDTVQREAFLAAARELLSWRLGDQCYNMTLEMVDELINEFAWDEISLEKVEAIAQHTDVVKRYSTSSAPAVQAPPQRLQAPMVQVPRDKVFVDGQHGLGNRLRAIGSAAAIADATDRELVIVWEPDAHSDCKFSDLFDYHDAVIEKSFFKDTEAANADLVNYMEIEEGAQKDSPVELVSGRNIYLRSAFVLRHPASTWTTENDFLQSLHPAQSVTNLTDSVRWPNDLTAHIRMQGGKQYEHLAWEAPENWSSESHQLVAEWREKSHFSHFIKRIDQLIETGEVNSIFIAADLPETYDEFNQLYGEKVRFLNRDINDRSAEQLKYALADAILLSQSPRMLGSTWSSFSELAMRLATTPMQVEMSGTDF